MKNKYDVKRIIPDELSESLDIFLKNYSETGLSDYNTYLFYGFILKSYKLPRENRYSIKLEDWKLHWLSTFIITL